MKRIIFFLSLLIFLNNSLYSANKFKKKYIAKVKILKGKSYIKIKDKDEKRLLKINQKIPVNSEIITSKNGYVTLFFKGGSLVEVKPNSYLIINKSFINKNKVSLSLIKGKSKFKIKKLLKNSDFQVFTPTAVVGVRGTEYEIQIADDGSLGVNVEDGKIDVTSDKENAVVGKNQNAEVNLENPNVNVNNKIENLNKWNKQKKKELYKNPDKKIKIIKLKFVKAKKSQNNIIKNIDKYKKNKIKLENDENSFFKNIAGTKGLYTAAKNINNANKNNKKVGRLFKAVQRMYSALEKLNKQVEQKFNKLDEYYNKKSAELEQKFNKLDNEIDKKFSDDDFDK